MLSFACRRFRARFTPGSAHAHRRACGECEAFASAVERAAGARLPLPPDLRRRLSSIAAPPVGAVLPFPVPRLPMSNALAERLRAIPSPSRRRSPPEWVRSPRYAIAASVLLTLLLAPLLTSAADRGAEAVREEVSPLLQRTRETGKEEIGRLRTGTVQVYGDARRSAEESLYRLDAEVFSLSSWLSTVATEESTDQDPHGEAAGSSRRTR